MPNLYQIVYDDLEGNRIKVNIQQPGTLERSATIIPTQGFAIVEFDGIDDPFTPIRPSICRITLEADQDQDFSELYAETEREWGVLLYRNDELKFRGWLSPDGIFEDYVSDAWQIELEARDGLGDLENKSYVDGDGNLYEGKTSLRNVVFRCLSRTGQSQYTRFQHRSNSVSNFPIEVEATPKEDFFDQQVDQRAFLSSDGKTALSCAEVLTNILTACNGHLFSWDGEWYINWNLQLVNPNVEGAFKYTKYEIDGTGPITESENVNYTIGSQIKGFPIHWAGENQRIERRPSLGAASINYEYKAIESILSNPELDNDGVSISGWTESPATGGADVVVLNDDGTVRIDNGNQTTAVFVSDASATDAEAGTLLRINLNFSVPKQGLAGAQRTKFKIRVLVTDGVTPYYLNNNLEWQTGATDVTLNFTKWGDFEYSIDSDILPITGAVTLSFYPIDDNSGSTSFSDQVTFNYISVQNLETNPPQGETHNAERVAKPSSFIQPSETVIIGDFSTVNYLGTLFRSDGTSTTGNGYVRPVSAFPFPLYQTNVIDRLFLRAKPARVFEGDVYGFFPPNSRIAIDGFPGVVWGVMGWTWDTKEGIISTRLWEMFWQENSGELGLDNAVLDDTQYDRIVNYGNVIEPTIKG